MCVGDDGGQVGIDEVKIGPVKSPCAAFAIVFEFAHDFFSKVWITKNHPLMGSFSFFEKDAFADKLSRLCVSNVRTNKF